MNLWIMITVFVISTLAGYRLLSEVPSLLHTPLMSGMNALSGITVLGAMVAAALALGSGSRALGMVAVVLAMINVTGGFLVTDRILRMFKSDK